MTAAIPQQALGGPRFQVHQRGRALDPYLYVRAAGKHRGHVRVPLFLILKLLLVAVDSNLHTAIGGGEQGLGNRFIGETVKCRVNMSPRFGEKRYIHPLGVYLRRVIECMSASGQGGRGLRSWRRLPCCTELPQHCNGPHGCRELVLMMKTAGNPGHRESEEKIAKKSHGVTSCNAGPSDMSAMASGVLRRAAFADSCRASSCFALRRSRFFLFCFGCAVEGSTAEALGEKVTCTSGL